MFGEEHGDAGQWRGRINELLYGLLFKPALNETVADDMAQSIFTGRGFTSGSAEYAEAIRQALAQSGPLNDAIDAPHSEEQIRAFLSRLLGTLEATKR